MLIWRETVPIMPVSIFITHIYIYIYIADAEKIRHMCGQNLLQLAVADFHLSQLLARYKSHTWEYLSIFVLTSIFGRVCASCCEIGQV